MSRVTATVLGAEAEHRCLVSLKLANKLDFSYHLLYIYIYIFSYGKKEDVAIAVASQKYQGSWATTADLGEESQGES